MSPSSPGWSPSPVRVHETRVRVHSAWVRVHRGGVRVRVRVHKGRVRVRTWVRTRTRTQCRTHPLTPSPSPDSLQHCKIGILMAVMGVKWDKKGPTGISTYKYFPKTPSGPLKVSFCSTFLTSRSYCTKLLMWKVTLFIVMHAWTLILYTYKTSRLNAWYFLCKYFQKFEIMIRSHYFHHLIFSFSFNINFMFT